MTAKLTPRESLTLPEHVDNTALFDPETLKYDLLMRLLYSKGGEKRGEYVATAVDLRTLRDSLTKEGLSDEQLLSAVAVQLGNSDKSVSMDELDESHPDKNKCERAQLNYQRISKALRSASSFILNELNFPLPAAVANSTVKSRAELIALLKRVTLFKEGEKGLGTHLAYCALIKATLATLELETRFAESLEREAKWLQDTITQRSESNNFTPLVDAYAETPDEIKGMLTDIEGKPCSVDFAIRDKRWQSIVRKFLGKPESNAEEAYKDEIAMRFKLDGRRLGTVARIVSYLNEQCDAKVTKIANKGVVGNLEFARLFSSLKQEEGCSDMDIDPDSNPKTDPDFAVLQLNGVMKVPPDGDVNAPRNEWRPRKFEIQFVDTKRKPHLELASDSVYAMKKDIIIATRLFGGVRYKWLLERAKKASLDSHVNMSPEKILTALEEDKRFIFKKPGSQGIYAATEVWERWLNIPGLILNEDMRRDIGHKIGMSASTS